MAEFPKQVEVEVKWLAAIAKPGDTLIIGINNRIDALTVQTIVDRVQHFIPLVTVFVVDQVSSMVVYRPDEQS